jgi:hypothetical protein
MRDETGVTRMELEDYLVGALPPPDILVVEEALFASSGLRKTLAMLAPGPLLWRVGECRLAAQVTSTGAGAPPVRRLGLAAGTTQVMLEVDVAGLEGWSVRMLVAKNADGQWDHDLELLGPPGAFLPLGVSVSYSPRPDAQPRTLRLDPTVGAWFAEQAPPPAQAVLQADVLL